MLRSCTVVFLRHQQVDEAAWREVERFIADWNCGHAAAFESVGGLFWQLTLTERQSAELTEVLAALKSLRARHGVVAATSQRDTPEPEDYAQADFVTVLGAVIEESRPLLTNEAEVFRPAPPCPRCGANSGYDLTQTGPLAVDLTVRHDPSVEGEPAPAGGWDAVNLTGERLLVSDRLAAQLPTGAGSGVVLRPVLDAATGEPTDRAFQLASDLAVVDPCPVHTRVLGDPFCPVCGTAYGIVEGYVWVPRQQVADRAVIARHRSGDALFAFLGPRHRALVAAGISGLDPSGLFMLCAHHA